MLLWTYEHLAAVSQVIHEAISLCLLTTDSVIDPAGL